MKYVSPWSGISVIIERNVCHHRAESVSSLNGMCVTIEWNMWHHITKYV